MKRLVILSITGAIAVSSVSKAIPEEPPKTATGSPPVKITGSASAKASQRKSDRPQSVSGALMSLNFKDTEIRDIINTIAGIAGINIVVDPSVQGRTTIILRNVSLDEALTAITMSGQFTFAKTGNVYTFSRSTGTRAPTVRIENGRLTLEANRAEIKEVLRLISASGAITLVPAQNVTGEITQSLKDVPLMSGLSTVLAANNLTMEEKGDGIYLVDHLKPKPAPPVEQVRPTLPPPSEIIQPIEPRRPKFSTTVTMDVESLPLSEIFKRIAEQTGASILLQGEFNERKTVHFTEVPVEDAIASLLIGTKYSYIREASASAQTTKHSEQKPNESEDVSHSNSEDEAIEPIAAEPPGRFIIGGDSTKLTDPSTVPFLVNEIIVLKHLRATDVAMLFSAAVSKDAVKVLKDQNAVSVIGTRDQVARIKEELQRLDTPAQQIMIQAVVIEMTLNQAKDLGIEFGVNNNEILATGPTGSMLTFRTTGGFGKQFTATLTALITQGRAKVLANPRIATINGKEANIDITDTRFFRTAGFPETQIQTGGTSAGSLISPFAFGTIQSIEAGIKLRITPWVGSEGDILVDVAPEVSSVVGTGPDGLPELNKRTATTTIRVRNGESIIIGGLRQKEESKSVTKPFLIGDIPLIGNLFRRTVKNRRETDLVILITPRLVDSGSTNEISGKIEHPEIRRMLPRALDLSPQARGRSQ